MRFHFAVVCAIIASSGCTTNYNNNNNNNNNVAGVVDAFRQQPAYYCTKRTITNTAFLGPPSKYDSVVAPRTRQQQQQQQRSTKTTTTSSSIQMTGMMGWDNENFLESLGKGQDAIKEANDQYNRLSRFGQRPVNNEFDDDTDNNNEPPSVPGVSKADAADELRDASIPGATLSEEQIERIKRQNEDEKNASGGEMFRKLMERAAERPPTPSQPQMNPLVNPLAAAAPAAAAATTSGGGGLPANFASLSVEQQAALFRELMLNPQQAPPPLPVPTGSGGGVAVAKDGKRFGRNRDADAIVNSSDVYLTQLKIDSNARNVARYAGDDETANTVFGDPRIKEIKLHINPYMEEQRRLEREMLGTAAEEMLTPLVLGSGGPKQENDISYSGQQYKNKLLERKKQKQQQQQQQQQQQNTPPSPVADSQESPIMSSVATPPPPQQQQQRQQAPIQQDAVIPPPPLQKPVMEVTTPVPSTPSMSTDTVTTTPTAATPFTSASSTTSTTTSSDSADTSQEALERQDLRTLMGLLYKHRGGPGFGVGRIQGNEMQRFINLADKVVTSLKNEPPLPQLQQQQSQSSSSSSSFVMPQRQTNPSVPATASSSGSRSMPGGAIAQVRRVPIGDNVNGMIACLEGAIQMYKYSPSPELQDNMLITLRAAMLSAINTLSEVISTDIDTSSSMATQQAQRIPIGERLNGMIACLEGAIQMYKYSPSPELQGNLLITLRAALLSGVNTLNEVIADKDVRNYETFRTEPPTTDNMRTTQTRMPFEAPQQYTEAELAYEEEETEMSAAPTKYAGDDENSKFLEQVYTQLMNAAGDDKMGLRNSLTPTEAQELADNIAEMRAMLVEELNSGIPASQQQQDGTAVPPSTAKYQELIAKLKAEKNKEK